MTISDIPATPQDPGPVPPPTEHSVDGVEGTQNGGE